MNNRDILDFRRPRPSLVDYLEIIREAHPPVNELEIYESARRMVSRVLGCREENILFTGDPYLNLCLILDSIWTPSMDRIIACDYENHGHLGIIKTSRVRGFKHKILGIGRKNISSLLDELKIGDISLILASHVTPLTGVRIDLASIGRISPGYDAILAADFTESFSQIHININDFNVDIGYGELYKCTPGHGSIGYIYFSDRIKDSISIDVYTPLNTKILGGENGDNTFLERRSGLDGLRIHNPNPLDLIYISRYIEDRLRIGIGRVSNHILSLGGLIIDELSRLGYIVETPRYREERGGIISIFIGKHVGEVYNYLSRNNVLTGIDRGRIKLYIDYDKDEDEAYTFIELMKRIRGRLNLKYSLKSPS